MTVLAWLWLASFAVLAGLSLRRPVWAVALYFLTYFALPEFWWWGTESELADGYRWNLIAGIALAVAVAVDVRRRGPRGVLGALRVDPALRWMLILLGAMALNALAVHALLAPDPATSRLALVYLLKHSGLSLLIFAALRTPKDGRIFTASLLAGALYLGIAVVFAGEGEMINGRLELVGPASAREANGLPSLLFVIVPLAWGAVFRGPWAERLLAFSALVLGLRVIYLCNSRGAYISAVAAVLAILALAPRDLRRSWLAFCMLGALLSGLAAANGLWAGLWRLSDAVQIETRPAATTPAAAEEAGRVASPAEAAPEGEPDAEAHTGRSALERFVTIPQELADPTASSAVRLRFWKAGVLMVLDHPLGSGGDGFLRVRGPEYLARVGVRERRSVHNSYLEEATSWGVQGLLLRLASCALLGVLLWRAAHADQPGCLRSRVDACALAAALATLLVSSVFGRRLQLEWLYWLIGWAMAASSWQVAGRRAGGS